ncbi:MAG: NF038122 family metalloprotease [Blastocatellia bacterium]
MQRAFRSVRKSSLSLLMISLVSLLPTAGAASTSIRQSRTRPLPVPESHAFINYRTDGRIGCREATEAEASALKRRANQSMHVISPTRSVSTQSLSAESAGLQIVLRATGQLENFPTAKAAFLNAAATWQSLISTPITVIIDVDFGPTWFGESYDEDVLGQTDSQTLGDSSIYSDVRDSLVGLAASDEQAGLFNQLPQSAVPTDIGTTSYVLAPSAQWRALGFINPVADPDSEQSDLGDPPAVGFNSDFDYDFDPSDGVDSNRIDFDSVAAHEIGHVLGFMSNTGYRELVRSSPVAVTIWDMFRFRPGVTSASFQTAQRILSSGGSQEFFDGSTEAALSTGRPDGTGGDREQSSHWKDDRLTGTYVGIMDPTLADGQRDTITDNDLAALRSFGYTVVGDVSSSDAPTIKNVSFNGRKLKIKGKKFNGVLQVEINGLVLASTLELDVNNAARKLEIRASQSVLNLLGGTNQVRVISNGVASNTFAFTL